MKIAILANDHPSFVKPMAEGLARMLSSLGEEATIFYDGHSIARGTSMVAVSKRACKNAAKMTLNATRGTSHRTVPLGLRSARQLKHSDVIILVANLPLAYVRASFPGVESLRDKLQKPIVLYDNKNLATMGHWIHRISEEYAGKTFGLERYDWYLSASAITELPMPHEFESFSLVGMDLDDGSLYSEPNKNFLAVVDFAREGHEIERDIQIQALEETATPYVILDKPMSIEAIRAIYRRASLFFLSFRESFGLPIVELQICGSYICAPYKRWAPAHYVDKSIFERGEGNLSHNFMIYDNDKTRLKDMIYQARQSYSPSVVIEEFKKRHPHLYHGDLVELRRFLDRLEDGTITHNSHNDYHEFNESLVTEP